MFYSITNLYKPILPVDSVHKMLLILLKIYTTEEYARCYVMWRMMMDQQFCICPIHIVSYDKHNTEYNCINIARIMVPIAYTDRCRIYTYPAHAVRIQMWLPPFNNNADFSWIQHTHTVNDNIIMNYTRLLTNIFQNISLKVRVFVFNQVSIRRKKRYHNDNIYWYNST